MTAVPADWPVQPIGVGAFLVEGTDPATCGVCGRVWDDAKVTSLTPVPSGRCPFEAFHDEEPEPDVVTVRGLRLLVATAEGAVIEVTDELEDYDLTLSFARSFLLNEIVKAVEQALEGS